MDDLEDGELPSSPDQGDKSEEDEAPSYNPLPRPAATRPRSATNSSTVAHAGDFQMQQGRQNPTESSDDQSSPSSDSETSDEDSKPTKGKRKMMQRNREPSQRGQEHNAKFASMARDFQQKRKNNIWGSILQEETLNSELQSSLGVGRKSLKDLGSDRGAETYDFNLAAEAKAKEEAEAAKGAKQDLDRELDAYFEKPPPLSPEDDKQGDDDDDVMDDGRRQDAIRAGVKRSVKDRLGSRRRDDHQSDFDPSMSIPPPGKAREIPDITPGFLATLKDPANNVQGARRKVIEGKEDRDNDDEDEEGCVSDDEEEEGEETSFPKSHTLLGQELATRLYEPKKDLMIGVVDVVGLDVALDLFQKTRQIEAQGGMMIINNARRRTPGGVFLHLLRQMSSSPNTSEVTSAKIKTFFAQSNQHQAHNKNVHKKRRYHMMKGGKAGDFAAELQSFKKFSQHQSKKREKKKNKKQQQLQQDNDLMEQDAPAGSSSGSGDLKPLPDILTCITQRIGGGGKGPTKDHAAPGPSSSRGTKGKSPFQDPDVFDEPDAPPNSVEQARSINQYDDDFLTTAADTEDIELF